MKEENALHRTNPEFLTVPAQTTRASDLLLASLRPAARRVRVEHLVSQSRAPRGRSERAPVTAWGRTDWYYELLF